MEINCADHLLSSWNKLLPVQNEKIMFWKNWIMLKESWKRHNKKKTVSLTDPESRWMKNKKNR